ncbi:MAG: Uroporphyrinogen III decarboxylase [uncultured Thermomicrobiales bacterium]|uniref:Uroporphyrinogen decarboxylase n=1 Tax=uncultured Thermomicrobiales bacterium TaxID=1645740 RepID=A0A6J4UY99_9BACT|nr:MAG: Uroporphyrinogen III decarboxylase [uncultured Thermomicrobiales bacterium]
MTEFTLSSVNLTMSGRQRFLAAANREAVDATPVWFMRQAGRCLPEYRALRKVHSFLEVARTPELAVEATLMPIDRFGVDGAVLFADIMLPLEGMGVDFEIRPGVGPVIANPIRTAEDVSRIRVVDPEEGTPYVLNALRLLRQELGDRAASLGFAGAPFTLACYLVDGRSSREYPQTKAMMYGQPELWHELMERITEVTIRYLRGQVAAGADAVQLFDSWLGLLAAETYRTRVAPYTSRIFSALRGTAPTIHFSTGTAQLLAEIGRTGPDIVSVDWRLPLDTAWSTLDFATGIQGNLDPTILMAPWPVVEAASRDVLRRAAGRAGHVFNLGHGILPETDPDQLARVVETVHAYPSRQEG